MVSGWTGKQDEGKEVLQNKNCDYAECHSLPNMPIAQACLWEVISNSGFALMLKPQANAFCKACSWFLASPLKSWVLAWNICMFSERSFITPWSSTAHLAKSPQFLWESFPKLKFKSRQSRETGISWNTVSNPNISHAEKSKYIKIHAFIYLHEHLHTLV